MITLASQLLEKTVSSNASDVFIVAGLPGFHAVKWHHCTRG